jgi:uncharacterized membrane protein
MEVVNMWSRSDLKSRAKNNLRNNKYWMALLVTIIMGFLAGEGGSGFGGTSVGQLRGYKISDGNFQGELDALNRFFTSSLFQLLIAVMIAAVLLGIAWKIFISGPVKVGSMRWFSRSRESAASPTLSLVFSLFRKDHYLGSVAGMLWHDFWLFIWGLISAVPIVAALGFFIFSNQVLTISNFGISGSFEISPDQLSSLIGVILVVAGIVLSAALSIIYVAKTYGYSLVPWLLADNPNLGARRALTLSRQLTRTHRFEMFVLDLSFIGWYLLGLLACCIGVIFVNPYYYATKTELYTALREIGVQKGIVTMEELGYRLVNPDQDYN